MKMLNIYQAIYFYYEFILLVHNNVQWTSIGKFTIFCINSFLEDITLLFNHFSDVYISTIHWSMYSVSNGFTKQM